MPNIKSAKKRVKVSEVKALRNKIWRSTVKNALKKFDAAVATGVKSDAAVAYVAAIAKLDKAAAHGIIHKNKAAHKKSQLTLKLNQMA